MNIGGALAEWLRSGLQNRVHQFNSGRRLHLIMNILYCGDNGISRGVLVSILSLLMRGKKENIYHIFIATIKYKNVVPFSKKTADFLDNLVKKYNKNSFVKLIDATEVFTKNLPKKNMNSYFTPCSMLRLYADKMPELKDLTKILYLDYDVVARKDIEELYEINIDDYEAAGALDIYGKNFYYYHGLKQDYMNSGVMLFNLKKCRENKVFERAVLKCVSKKMMLADQAALNKVIEKRKILPRKYNEQSDRPKSDTVLHHFSNNFKFFPFFHVQKVKPFEIKKIHRILKITEYDDILDEYERLSDQL